MSKSGYSNELVNLVKQFLIEDDWHFFFDEDEGIFDFGLKIKNKIQKINYIVDVREDEILVYGMCPICADCNDANMMAQMAEFLCRANYRLENGCFEFDYRDGEIRFRSFIDCDGSMPSSKVIKNSIYCTAVMYERYAAGIVGIIFSGYTAKEAIAQCEKSTEDELRSAISEVTGENMEDANAEELLACLEAHLDVCLANDTEDESDEDLENFSDEIRVNPFERKKEGGAV